MAFSQTRRAYGKTPSVTVLKLQIVIVLLYFEVQTLCNVLRRCNGGDAVCCCDAAMQCNAMQCCYPMQ